MSFGPVLDAALEAQAAIKTATLQGCVIGGVAQQRWGEPRYTADVDLTVLVEPGDEARVTSLLLSCLAPRVENADEFALRSRVLLARSNQGIGLDIVLAGLPFEADVVKRASPWQLNSETNLFTCSAEDLIIMKVFAARDKDWADVTSVLERQNKRLDFELVRRELKPLLAAKEAPELAGELEMRIKRHAQRR